MKQKIFFILLILISPNLITAQQYSFNIDGIILEFNYQINTNTIIENVSVKNETSESIFIPYIADTSLHCFILQNNSYSYLGIKHSILGPANLGGKVFLMEVKGGKYIDIKYSVPYSRQPITEYHIAIDFIKKEDLSGQIEVNESTVATSSKKYMRKSKCFYFISKTSMK